tara:strand:+ start:1240 stop:1473 length:234 start_codon:yes stop_codon:yes gene_type:complete
MQEISGPCQITQFDDIGLQGAVVLVFDGIIVSIYNIIIFYVFSYAGGGYVVKVPLVGGVVLQSIIEYSTFDGVNTSA